MIFKFLHEESAAIILGKGNAGRLFHASEEGVIYLVTSMDGLQVFATPHKREKEVWLIYGHTISPNTNERQAEAAASAMFAKERSERLTLVCPLAYAPKIQEGTIIQANEGDPDSGVLYLGFRPIVRQERDALMAYYSDSDIRLQEAQVEMDVEPYD